MSDKTKAVNLTEDEIETLITSHGQKLYDDKKDMRVERISYLNKRLKAFKEAEEEKSGLAIALEITPNTDALNPENQKQVKANEGWGTESNG